MGALDCAPFSEFTCSKVGFQNKASSFDSCLYSVFPRDGGQLALLLLILMIIWDVVGRVFSPANKPSGRCVLENGKYTNRRLCMWVGSSPRRTITPCVWLRLIFRPSWSPVNPLRACGQPGGSYYPRRMFRVANAN